MLMLPGGDGDDAPPAEAPMTIRWWWLYEEDAGLGTGQKAGGTTTFVATEVNVCIVEILIAFA